MFLYCYINLCIRGFKPGIKCCMENCKRIGKVITVAFVFLSISMLKAILFDMGSTLVIDIGLRKNFVEAMHKLLKNHININRAKIELLFDEWDHITYRESLEEYWDLFRSMILLKKLGLKPNPLLVEEVYETIVNVWVESYVFEEGAVRTVKELKNLGYQIGIISNTGSHDLVYREIKRAGLTHFIDVIITSQAVGWKKPSPKIFKITLDMIGVKPEQAVHVGDDPIADVEGAKKAGLWAVQKMKKGEKVSPYADAVVYKIVEIPKVLEELLRRLS